MDSIVDPELGEISWTIVGKCYQEMSSPHEQQRIEANKWLVKFYNSESSK